MMARNLSADPVVTQGVKLRYLPDTIPGMMDISDPPVIQCTWGKETAKKARTQQHFESLMNHIKGLERRVHELEGELQRYKDPNAQPEAGPSAIASSLSDKASPLAKSESDDADGQLDSSGNSTDGSDIDKLIAPTRNLVVRHFSRLCIIPIFNFITSFYS